MAPRPSMIVARIKEALTIMGTKQDAKPMQPPATAKNTSGLAWEFMIASDIASLAEKRKNKAKAACIEAGVIFDSVTDPEAPGTKRIVFDDEFMQIQVRVSQPTQATDHKQFVNALEGLGVDKKTITTAEQSAMKENRASHTFTTMLKGGPPPTNGK